MARKPKVDLVNADPSRLVKGDKVKVKVGDNAKNATILEMTKENARVELDNGLTITVTTDRLFL